MSSAVYGAEAFGGVPWLTPKDPAEDVPYAYDFNKELAELGTTITGTPVFAEEGTSALSLSGGAESAGIASVVVSGGVAGRDYVVKCTATLVTGAVLIRRAILSVETR